ncbi:kidney disease 1-like 2 isoform X1 [Octopus vulgaris]|uniref:Kidney disease 1-like 2 isoform X1 n=1 Tax=Octopus vulgaris TaxID=6645 RepID=A0AA36BYJ5_OCTVU|nr:kidney disease 1-like 2 isoform X1 [Octopus vulgaris]
MVWREDQTQTYKRHPWPLKIIDRVFLLVFLFGGLLLTWYEGQRILLCVVAQKPIPYDTFKVSNTIESKASKSTMNVELSCLDGEFMERLLEAKSVDLMGDDYVRTDCIVPKSKYLTIVASGSESVKLTTECAKGCLGLEGKKGNVRYQLNCNTGQYEVLGVDDLFQCNFADLKKEIHCFDARNMKGASIIVATGTDKQYLFLSSQLVKDGYPNLISLEVTMNLDSGQAVEKDDVNRYRYNIQIQILPYLFEKRCEMKPQSGFQTVTLYKLYCKDLSLFSQKAYFFYSLSYKGLVPYIKQDEKLGESLEASFTLPAQPNYQVDVHLYVYSVSNGKTCMEILSTFRYTVKPPITFRELSDQIDRAMLIEDVKIAKESLLYLTSEVNKHSTDFNKAYSFYTENEKEEGLKNFIALRQKLLRAVYRLQVDKAQKLSDLSTLMDEITKKKREFNSPSKLICSEIYSNFAIQLKEGAAAGMPRDAVHRDARYLVSSISHMLSSYEVEPRFKMTAEEKKKSIRVSIKSVDNFLSAINLVSAGIWLGNPSRAQVVIRSPNSVLNVIMTSMLKSGVCDGPYSSSLYAGNTDISVVFKCQPENNTSKGGAAVLSAFLIYENPYALAESIRPNYPVLSIRGYTKNPKLVDVGPKYFRASGPKVWVDLQWKKFILKFDFRREGNFLYPHYSRNFSIPMITLKSSQSSNHHIFINLDEGPFPLDVVVHLTRKLSHKQFVLGNFQRLSESRVSHVDHVNYTVLVPVGSVKEKVYFVMVKPFRYYAIADVKVQIPMNKMNDNKSHRGLEGPVENIEIPMHFGFMSKLCLNWNDNHNVWSEKNCKLSNSSVEFNQAVECTCEKSNVLSARFFVPPNVVHPIDDAYRFAEVFTNPIMLLVVLLAWVIYIGLLHLTKRLDWRDRESASLTVLSNDLTGYIYLVCVKTKWWLGSGTTARVYLVLMGARGHSSIVYLRDSHKQCFQSGDANWFLLTTENGIGDIEQILIWHDNSGSSPDWNLDYVTIQDLQTKDLWLFVLSDWMSPNRGLCLTHAFLKPSDTIQQNSHRWKIFRLEVLNCFQRTHQWFSYIFTPPSSFTRAQRLTCTFALLLALMLGNIMFYGVPTDDPEKEVTIGSMKMSVTPLIIGLQTSLVIIPVGLVLTQLFIQVKPRFHDFFIVHKKETKLKPEIKEEEEREMMAADQKRKRNTENKSGSYSFSLHVRPSLSPNVYNILQSLIGDESSGSGPSGANAKVKPKKGTTAGADDKQQDSRAELKKDMEKEQETGSVYLERSANAVAPLPKTDAPDDHVKDSQKDKTDEKQSSASLNQDKGDTEDSNTKKESKKFSNPLTSHGFLPWWFVYISWTITLTFCLISTYFIMLYGLTYGYEMSIAWTVAFFTSLVQSIFLEQPFEILLKTAVIVLVRKKPNIEVFYISMVDIKDKNFMKRIHDICHYEGNYSFVIHLPLLATEKKTDNGPELGPEKNFATA